MTYCTNESDELNWMVIEELQVMLALVLVYLCRNLFSIKSLDENRIDVQLSLMVLLKSRLASHI